jgi:hypothetical protein
MTVANTLAYYDTKTIGNVERFYGKGPWDQLRAPISSSLARKYEMKVAKGLAYVDT